MPAGAPSKYDPSNNRKIYKLALLGAKDKEIADFLEIAVSTFHEWKKKYPELTDSLKKGKEIADQKVTASLYKRAIGFKFDEVTYEDILDTRIDHFGNTIHVPVTRIKTVRKLIIPDTTAQIYWTKNRRPDLWRDKQEVEHSGEAVKSFNIIGAGNKGNKG